MRRATSVIAVSATIAALAAGALALRPVRSFIGLVALGDSRKLSARGAEIPAPAPGAPSALVLAIDGVDRRLLHEALDRGELPHLSRLLGPNVHRDERVLSPLPSSTASSWASAFTGEPPGRHGVAGNEYFIRAKRRMAAPAPLSFVDPSPVLETYTDGYANALLRVPTVYEQMRDRDPSITSWVSMSQYHAGADLLLLANRTVVADAFEALLAGASSGEDEMKLYAQLDQEAVENLVEALDEHEPPRLLTVYLTGTDHYAHGADGGPDPARARYLAEIVDPLIGRIHEALDAHRAMDDRTTIVLSDHGHTEVPHDAIHAIGTDEPADPPAVLTEAGFRVRPFELTVDADATFSAVIAYGGALAYVYVADRSTCPDAAGPPCDWSRDPRAEDVEAAADALHRAASDERHPLAGSLDMILAPRSAARRAADDAAGEGSLLVYLGDGAWEPLEAHLRAHPHPTYIDVVERFDALVDGPAGRNAGDLILVARNGGEARVEDRFYFAGLYHSWHGSPSRQDSEVPFIVAHPTRPAAALRARVDRALESAGPTVAVTTRLLLDLLAPESDAPRSVR